jgi:hypothetical protein
MLLSKPVVGFLLVAVTLFALPAIAGAGEIKGDYLETRTCDIYTGPCFANAQIGATGREALMAWSIDSGKQDGVDLAGLKVVLAVKAADTLGYGGGLVINPDPIKSVVLVDSKANARQKEALVDFVRARGGKLVGEIVRVETVPIQMSVDHVDMVGKLQAGNAAEIVTRKIGKTDCVCTNEMIFYPPLAAVDNSSPAVTVEGGFHTVGLGSRWTNPNSRSAFLATFDY